MKWQFLSTAHGLSATVTSADFRHEALERERRIRQRQEADAADSANRIAALWASAMRDSKFARSLTPAERDVMSLIAKGVSMGIAGAQLNFSTARVNRIQESANKRLRLYLETSKLQPHSFDEIDLDDEIQWHDD